MAEWAYNTKGFRAYLNHAQVQSDGTYVIERNYLELTYVYNNPKTTVENLKTQIARLPEQPVAAVSLEQRQQCMAAGDDQRD